VESSQTPEPLSGEIVEAEPRYGTLAWLALKPHVMVMGRELPSCHRVPEGATWRSDSERGTRCALEREDGSQCGAPATKRYGLCLVHAGGGVDPRGIAAEGGAVKTRLKLQRQLLGYRTDSPRAMARAAVAARSADVAQALLAPLDDRKLGSLERQRAASVLLGETFPLSTAIVELELPSEPGEVEALGWAELQALATGLLADQG